MPRTRTIKNPNQVDIFEVLATNEEARTNLKGLISISKNAKNDWRGLQSVPPSSFMETVLTAFYKNSDISLEIPFFITISLISAELVKRDVEIHMGDIQLKPDLWTVILASSGAGKTVSQSNLMKWTKTEDTFPNPSSSAKFIEDLSRHEGKGFWLRDEFAQFLKSLEQQPHMAEMRDYLLRIFDNKSVERNTKQSEIIVENPVLTILGLTVLETFNDNVSAESMLDGFAQRFSYVIAKPDPERHFKDYPIYEFSEFTKKATKQWEKLQNSIKHQVYQVTPEGRKAFEDAFKLLFRDDVNIPASFYRRVLWRAIKYALVYHFMLGKTSKKIDAEDMAWAARVSQMHLQDASEMLAKYNLPEFEKVIVRAEEVKAKCEAEGKPFNARALIRSMNAIKNSQQAEAIIKLIS